MRICTFLWISLAFYSSLAAQIVSSGGYTFDVDIQNRYHRWIHSARVDARVSGNRAEIRVKARGYKDGRASLTVNSKDKTYRVRMVLDDPWVRFRVKDQNSDSISHWVREDGFGAFADEYQFEVRLREEGFENLHGSDVEVRINGIPAWGARVDVRGTGSSRRMKVRFYRRNFLGFGINIIEVEVPRDSELALARKKQVQKIQFLLQNQPEVKNVVLEQRLKAVRQSLQ